jgi:hypothetical protein
MLTPLGDYFQNLGAALSSNVNIGEASLNSPSVNISEGTLPSSLVNPVSSPVIGTPVITYAAAIAEEQLEEGEIVTMALQETVGTSSQRFVAETPQETAGDADARLRIASPPEAEMQDNDLGGGPAEASVKKAKARKGTTIVTIDFDESDEDVFDEEAENARASRLTKSTINVNIGEKVSCQFEKGASTG